MRTEKRLHVPQVDEHLRLVGESPSNIFALGDCNNVQETKLGFLARAQAQVAPLLLCEPALLRIGTGKMPLCRALYTHTQAHAHTLAHTHTHAHMHTHTRLHIHVDAHPSAPTHVNTFWLDHSAKGGKQGGVMPPWQVAGASIKTLLRQPQGVTVAPRLEVSSIHAVMNCICNTCDMNLHSKLKAKQNATLDSAGKVRQE